MIDLFSVPVGYYSEKNPDDFEAQIRAQVQAIKK